MTKNSGRYHHHHDTTPGSGIGKSWKLLLLSATLVLFYFLTFGNILGFRSTSRHTHDENKISLPQDSISADSPPPPTLRSPPEEILHEIISQVNDDPDEFQEQDQTHDKGLEEIGFVQGNFVHLQQTDIELIRYIRARYLTPPPPPEKPYNLKHPQYQKTALGKWVRNFYKDKRNGTFLEAGANTGESSNTIELEIELGWGGVLVECNPRVTPDLRNAGRKAWLATVCLSTTGYPQVVNMSVPETWTLSARLGPAWDLSTWGVNSNWTYLDGVETVPLYPILASVGITEVDYFSFDIEGAEWAVLKNFPFDKVLIKVMIIEVYFYTPEERTEMKAFLKEKGLVFIRGIEMDEIYVHNSLIKDGLTVEELAKI